MKPSRILVALALTTALAASARADRVTTILPLGAKASSAIATPGDLVTVGFLVSQGTGRNISIQVTRAKKSALAPDVRLIAPDGTAFDVAAGRGTVTATATSWRAKFADVPQTGLWRIEVRGVNGTAGGFAVAIKGRDTMSASGSTAVPTGGATDVFAVVGDGVALNVAAKRSSGSSIVPRLFLFDPTGTQVGSGPVAIGNAKTGTLSLKGFRLPLMGRYTLRFGATASGGGLSYAVSTAPAKIKGHVPTALPGPSFEVEPATVGRLDGSASTSISGGALTYRWAQVSGQSAPITDPATATPTFRAPAAADASLAFQLAVAENGVFSKAVTVAVEVATRPVADAGRSISVGQPAIVTLDGSGSLDRRGNGLRWSWRQLPGDSAAVSLSGADTPAPSFGVPAGQHVLHFGLTVDDGRARSFEDVAVVGVGDVQRPVADAGREQFVPAMASVHLSGLATHTGSGVLDAPMAWTQISGPAVVLDGATSPWPSFTAPTSAGDFVFELNVGTGDGAADRVAVRVRPEMSNLPAAARAFGPAVTLPGVVTLTATGTTDPDGDPLSFQWGQIAGAPRPLSGTTVALATTGVPAGNEQFVYAVQANDGLQYGAPDVVSVRNFGYAGRPVAAAGPSQTTKPGVTVTLDGTGSARTDGGNGPLVYRWRQVAGRDWFDVAANVPGFDAAAARPSFVLPIDVTSVLPTETMVFELVVDDGTLASVPDLATVTFTDVPENGKPTVTAAASSTSPIVGETVTLVGTASDRDGDVIVVKWKQTAGTAVQLTPGSSVLSPTFVAPAQGTLTFQITGNDGYWDAAPATVSVTVDRRPVASLVGTPTAGNAGTLVTMDGTGSADPEAQALIYKWTQTAGPSVAIPAGVATFQFTAPQGDVTFRLVVNDGRQDSDPKTASFASTLQPPVPTTNAPQGQAAYGASVTLSANPPTGGPYTYTWRQINPSGTDPAVSLSSTSAQNPTFSVPQPTTAAFGVSPSAKFGVTVSDGTRTSPEGTVTVNFFASFNASGSTVYSIISNNCTVCHSGTNNTCPIYAGYEYGMGSASAFLSNSLNVTSCSSSKVRLPSQGTTGSSTNSFLLDRLKGISSSPMPPFGSLTGTQIRIVQDWIDQGCQNN